MSMQSNRFQCRQKDARCFASRLIKEYLTQDPRPCLVAYGTSTSMTIGFGARDALALVNSGRDPRKEDMTSGSPFAHGSELSTLIEENSGEYILGYLGFDLHSWAAPDDWTRPYPAASLLVPSCVVRVSASSFSVESGEATFLAGSKTVLGPCRCTMLNQVTALDFETAHDSEFDETLRCGIEWTHRGGERLTVSRRITPPISVDLVDSLMCGSSGSPLSRAFYARFPGVEFTGESPELLAHGSSQAFSAHKLSGTYPRSEDKRVDRDLSCQFQRDQKIRWEHDSSVRSLQNSLIRIGTVATAGPTILELPTLRHLVTRLDVRTEPGVRVIDCLKSVFPSGAEPRKKGLRVLASLERAPRGAYYGLVGMVRPDGSFSFSQSLRAVFRDAEGCHIWVGAAVTSDSTPQQEYDETRLKLSDIRLAASGH